MKKLVKVTIGVLSVFLLIAGVTHPPTQVFADTTSNNAHINVYLTASRPLIGNPRGHTMVSTRTSSSTGLRFRTTVTNSNGLTTSAPTNRNGVGADGWSTQVLSGGNTFASNVCPVIPTVTVTGTTRSGTVTGYASRRSTDHRGVVSWNSNISVSRSW